MHASATPRAAEAAAAAHAPPIQPLPPFCRGHDDEVEAEWSGNGGGGGGGGDGGSASGTCIGADASACAHCPDAWVWRSGHRARLVALTGAVPFNGEPPLSDLLPQQEQQEKEKEKQQGQSAHDSDAAAAATTSAVTPTALHYVRNHGLVPRLDADSFRLQVGVGAEDGDGAEGEGGDNAPGSRPHNDTSTRAQVRSWSLAALRALPSRTLLCTLSCDGLRRKELNLLEHTRGFDTGAASTGNSLWTGVLLRDLLRASGVDVDAVREAALRAEEGQDGTETKAKAEGRGQQQGEGRDDGQPPAAPYRFVCFEGNSSEDLPFGTYGTSLPLSYALDARNCVLVAYAQNGLPLRPDHGAPLRLVAPGLVGGRWVKWLSRIELSSHESCSAYHTGDNRRYPSSVSISDVAGGRMRGQAQWTLYELNVQCVITQPAHEQIAQLRTESGSIEPRRVRVGGFAFAGGGRRIVLVEVSADGGRSWMQARLQHSDLAADDGDRVSGGQAVIKQSNSSSSRTKASAGSNVQSTADEDPDAALARCASEWRRGRPSERDGMSARPKCWSWCTWSVWVPVWALLAGGGGGGGAGAGGCELIARAFDETHNGQPERLQWNATGMLNNAWYRVCVQACQAAAGSNDAPALRFLHPTLPGQQRGGWMRPGESNGSLPRPQHATASSGVPGPDSLAHVGPLIGVAAHKAHKLIPLSEVERHRSGDDCWVVMGQQVYDLSAYLKTHPGGPHALLAAAHMAPGGAEQLFQSIHAADAAEIAGRFLIGVVASDTLIECLTAAHGDAHTRRTPARATGKAEAAATAAVPPGGRAIKRFWSDFDVDRGADAHGKDGRLHVEHDETRGGVPPKKAHGQVEETKGGEQSSSDAVAASTNSSSSRPPQRCPAGASAGVRLSGSKDMLEPHRRPHWHERPDPDRAHPRTGEALFPRELPGSRFLLHSTRWCDVELTAVRAISPDTKLFTFRSRDGAFTRLGLSTGQHLLLAARIDDEWVVRPYTPVRPVSMDEDAEVEAESGAQAGKENEEKDGGRTQGEAAKACRAAEFDLLIKIYRPGHGMPGGRLTQHLDALRAGAGGGSGGGLRVQGPTGYVLYEGAGLFNIHTVPVRARRLNLIAGGTGITPLWQLMRAVLALGGEEERRAQVHVSLVFANSAPSGVLLRDQIEAMAREEPRRCRVCFVVSRLDADRERREDLKRAGQEDGHAQAAAPHPAPDHDELQPQRQFGQQSSPPPSAGHSCASSSSSPSSPPSVCLASGRVSELLLRRHLHAPSGDTLTFLCGPPPMIQAAYQHLFQLGFRDEQIVEF